jgi:taurine transport system permease protein
MNYFFLEYRNVFVAIIFISLLLSIIACIYKGRRVIATEKSDAVFGNPARAMGGWYWTFTGVASVLVLWLYFSWDTTRAFFPNAANQLCQVAKLESAINPMRTLFPLDNSYLRGTKLLTRDQKQLAELQDNMVALKLDQATHDQAKVVLKGLFAALADQANPNFLAPESTIAFADIANRIYKLAEDIQQPQYAGQPSQKQLDQAASQSGWGDSGKEIPVYPATPLSYRFDAAATTMAAITLDFVKIRNTNNHFKIQIAELNQRIKTLISANQQNTNLDVTVQSDRQRFFKQLNKIFKRVDDGAIFPPNTMDNVEAALIHFHQVQLEQQSYLVALNDWGFPAGKILFGSTACSEQGAGRWLPKPSDTLGTLIRIADPDIGYQGIPLLWYKWKPVSEMIGFLTPDWIANLVPGQYPRHNQHGEVQSNFKSKVYNFASGNYDSFALPIPMGHIWDSIVRVMVGLLLGIVLGVPLGLCMGLNRFAKGYFDPLVELYRPVPPLAWAPLILTIFGIHDDGKIFLLFMVAFAIMVISARTGATGTKLSKVHASHSLGASNWQILRQVILPNSLPEILTGIRISIGVCWGTLVAAEMLAGTTGIGFVENVARKQSDYEIIWVTIILLGVLGLLFDLIMRWVITRTIPWRGKG